MHVCLECNHLLKAQPAPGFPPAARPPHLPSVLVDTGMSGELQNDVSVAPDCWNLVIISSLW